MLSATLRGKTTWTNDRSKGEDQELMGNLRRYWESETCPCLDTFVQTRMIWTSPELSQRSLPIANVFLNVTPSLPSSHGRVQSYGSQGWLSQRVLGRHWVAPVVQTWRTLTKKRKKSVDAVGKTVRQEIQGRNKEVVRREMGSSDVGTWMRS